ncbi:hypothetical protein BGZ97_010306 [Linnemannia gamsii]|uniref:Uncharacterized protein n=1 Tax=Linnemannia gamsii TaxID=64522 RepID=A0A9P6QNJ0_9FUNG|nr:hypothetical protein BGZ97_010306 [Linnemannia gamsii]
MAAGAAAAAAAVVNTVSSAISEHIHPPSIYAAQPNSSALSSPWKGSQEGQQMQQYQLQQPFVLPSFSSESLEQAGAGTQTEAGGHTYHPPQEVFVPYLHPCEPSPTMDREEDPVQTSGSLSAAGLALGTSATTTPTSTVPVDNADSSSSSSGTAARSSAGVAEVQAALSSTATASTLTGATAKAVAATNATMAATATVQLNNWL